MGDVLQALEAIRRTLDLGGNVQAFIVENVQLVLEALRAFVLRTGNPAVPNAPFTTVGPIQSITPLVQVAADSALTAVVTYAGFRMMWGRTTARSQFVLRVLLPRLLLAAIMINFALPLVQAAVDASNALSDSVVLATKQQVLADAGEFGTTARTGGLGLQAVTLIVLFAAYAVLAFAYVVRFALLVVLTILAPAAALLFVLPETHRFAREWGGLFISALLMQPLQLLVLAVGFALDGYSTLPIRHLFALAAVWMTFKVPGALHSSTLAGSKATSIAKRHITHAVRAVVKA
jgi:hypothetical protein